MLAAPALNAGGASPAATLAAADVAPGYTALRSVRIVDTRTGLGTTAGPVTVATPRELQIAGLGGVPAAGTSAALLMVTSFATTGTGPHATSAIISRPGEPAPSGRSLTISAATSSSTLVIAPLDAAGRTALTVVGGSSHFRIDVQGYFAASTPLVATGGIPVLNTTTGLGRPRAGRVVADRNVVVAVAGVGGIPATGVASVIVHVTADTPDAAPAISVWGLGSARPVRPQLSSSAAGTTGTTVVVPLGSDGKLLLRPTVGMGVRVSVVGYTTDANLLINSAARTLVDTTTGAGLSGVVAPLGSTYISMRALIGTTIDTVDISAIVLKVEVRQPTSDGWLRLSAGGPGSANVRVIAGLTNQTTVIVPVSAGRRVAASLSAGTADLIVERVAVLRRPPAVAARWRMEPASVLVAPNEVRTVDLIAVDEAGIALADQPIVTSARVDIAGGSAAARYLGNRKVELTGSSTFASSIVTVTPANALLPAEATVSVVEKQAGVVEIPDASVVFPTPWVLGDDDVAARLGALKTADAVAGFTLTELQDRTQIDSGQNAQDPNAFADPQGLVPLILRGTPPATGTKLITAGGSGVSGEVIEPAGLPTLTRDGFSLVTVKLLPLADLYAQLVYSVDTASLPSTAAKLAVAAQGSGAADGAAGQGTAGLGFRRSAAPLASADPPGMTCEAKVGTSEIKAMPLLPSLSGSLQLEADVANGNYTFIPRITGAITAGFEVTMQGFAEAACEFPVGELGTIRMPAPLGPLTGLVNAFAGNEIVAKLGLKLKGGPQFKFGLKCTMSLTFQVGFKVIAGSEFYNETQWPEPGFGCEPTWPAVNGLNPEQLPLSLEITGQTALKVNLGTDIGGNISAALGRMFGSPHIGEVSMAELRFGPTVTFLEENQWNSFTEEKSGTKFIGTLKGEAAVKVPAFNWVLKALAGTSKDLEIKFWEYETPIPLLPSYEAPTASSLEYQVGTGDRKTLGAGDVVFVEPGDRLTVTSTLSSNTGTPQFEGVYYDRLTGWDKEPGFTAGAGGDATIATNFNVTQEWCDAHATGGNGDVVDFKIAGEASATLLGVTIADGVPLYAGKFKLQCVEGKMRFEPGAVTLDINGNASAGLKTKGSKADVWHIRQDASWSSWLSAAPDGQPANVPVEAGDEQSFGVTFTATQPPSCDEPKTAEVHAVSEHRGDARITVTQRDACTLHFQQPGASGNGTFVRLDLLSRGIAADTWTVVSMPSFVSVQPQTGALTTSTEELRYGVGVTFDKRLPTCIVQLPETEDLVVTSAHRGTARIPLTWPLVPRRSCKPDPAISWGDPHLTTFDGASFDAQVVGEYVYLTTTTDATTPVEIRALQELTAPEHLQAAPTSVVGMAFRVGDHRFVINARNADGTIPANGALRVAVDGETRSLADGTTDISDELSVTVTNNGHEYTVTAPGLRTRIVEQLSYLDMYIYRTDAVPFIGLLGNGDDDANNDFVVRGTTEQLTLEQVRAHGADMERWTQSWRITDPAASAFSPLPASFDDENLQLGGAALAPYRAQIAAMLGDIGAICDVNPADQNYLLDSLALELAIGRPVNLVAGSTCSYMLSGNVLASGRPVPGIPVRASMAGTLPCETTTGANGDYLCILKADPEFHNDPAVSLPFTATILVGTAGSEPLSSTTASFETKSVAGGSNSSSSHDITLADSVVPLLALEGTMLRDGAPVSGPVPITVVQRSGADVTGTTRLVVTPDPETGGYQVRLPIAWGSDSVNVMAAVGAYEGDYPTTSAPVTAAGTTVVPFGFDFRPTTISVTGRLLDGHGVRIPATQLIIQATNGTTLSLSIGRDIVTNADGTYATDVEIPSAATSVRVSTIVFNGELEFVTDDDLSPGSRTIVFDVVGTRPVVTLSGQVSGLDGDPGGKVFRLDMIANDAGGAFVQSIVGTVTLDADGRYSTSLELFKRVASVDFVLAVGDFGADYGRLSAAVVPGPNPLTLDVDASRPTLAVSGLATHDGLARGASMELDAIFYDAADQILSLRQYHTAVGVDGSYSQRIQAPRATTRVLLTAVTSTYFDDNITSMVTGLVSGTNPVTFDVATVTRKLHISGTILRNGGQPTGSAWIDATFRGPGIQPGTMQKFIPVEIGSDGSYVVEANMPRTATAATLRFSIPVADNLALWDYFAHDITIVDGVQTDTFDISFDTREVTFAGRMRGFAGIPSDPVTVNLRFHRADPFGDFEFTTLVDPDEAGNYTVTVPAPNNATSVSAVAELDVDSELNPTGSFTLLEGDQIVTFDAVVGPEAAHIHGALIIDGIAATTLQLTVKAKDISGNVIATRSVTPDLTDGMFDTLVRGLPEATAQVDVELIFDIDGVTNIWGTGNGATSGTVTDIPFDFRAQSVVLVGRMVDGAGTPVTNRVVSLEGNTLDGDGNSLGGYQFGVVLGVDGTFSTSLQIGIDGRRFDLTLPDGSVVQIPLTGVGPNSFELGDVSLIEQRELTISGSAPTPLDDQGTPISPAPVYLRIVPFAFEPGGYNQNPPYQPIGDPLVVSGEAVNGTYSTVVSIPAAATLVRVEARADTTSDWYSTGLVIDLADPTPAITLDIDDTGKRHLGLDTRTFVGFGGPNDCAVPRGYIFDYVAEEQRPDGSWTEAYRGVAVPDPTTGQITLRLPLQTDSTNFRISESVIAYPDAAELTNSSSTLSFDLPPDADIGTNWEVQHNC